jgi:hypothetical protein
MQHKPTKGKYALSINKLESWNCTPISTLDSYIKYGKIIYLCPQKHECEKVYSSFCNLKVAEKACITCIKQENLKEKYKILADKCKKKGFTFKSFDPETRTVYYTCLCGNDVKSHESNLGRSVSCSACQHDKQRHSEQTVTDLFNEAQLKLCDVTQYKNKESKMDYICKCGERAEATYNDVRNHLKFNKYKDVGCRKCQNKRTANNMSDGLHDNVFQMETVKEKSKKTCVDKYGTSHVRQNKEMQKKYEDRLEEKIGVRWAFTQPHVLEKIKEISLSRWGTENPFSSNKFHDEFREVIKATCVDKYGCEYVLNSKHYKDLCMEKYGKPYVVNTSHFKTVMMEKYGYEHALQCPKIFRKTMKKMFSTKSYILPSGKDISIMGYENICLDILLGKKKSDIYGRTYNEQDISVDVEPIEYMHDVKRLYFPDIEIINTLLIEVKSTYTFDLELEKNLNKFYAASRTQDFEVWIFNGKKNIETIITYKKNCEHGILSDGSIYDNKPLFKGKKLLKPDIEKLCLENYYEECE